MTWGAASEDGAPSADRGETLTFMSNILNIFGVTTRWSLYKKRVLEIYRKTLS